ncbi:translocation/assembly module TamB domain-containing protein [Pontixanthobacter gangjinensis]|uniref:Translocation/assembly module TamB n=1 Tax=Christiangramia aestuarii TaxID=1028746 RepID=A0A7K1LQN4_9FLAO|nr:translocation/assembly module TamB domain-containing protein [Christiangramia aestuarii]MUP42770.1 translocation/assembly module TamB [Christiangramia aestuarii]
MSDKKKKLIKVLKILGKIFLGILILILLLILFVRSPWGQNIIKDKLISSIEDKTGAEISLDKLFIQFDGDIQLDDLLILDLQGDTIAYAGSLRANIPLLPLIKGNSFSLDELEANKLTARVIRKDSVSGFNYEFLLEPYAVDTTQTQSTDTTSAPMSINIGNIDLKDFDIAYRDDVSGIDTKVKFQSLQLEFSKTDLQQMVFRADKVQLSKADINYVQTRPFPESDSEPPPLPILSVEDFELNEVNLKYDSQPDSLSSEVALNEFSLKNGDFDLKNNEIKTNALRFADSRVSLQLRQTATDTNQVSGQTSEFQWPDWKLKLGEIDIDNNQVQYSLNEAKVKKGEFDPNAISLDSLVFRSPGISYENKKAEVEIEQFRFKEGSGINLNEFKIAASISDTIFNIDGLDIGLNSNILQGSFTANYGSLARFINQPEKADLNLDLNNLRLDVNEIFRFQPSLKQNDYLRSLAASPVLGNIKANGNLDILNINPVNINWNNTRISGRGQIMNLQDPDNLIFDLPNVSLRSSRSDLVKFVKEEDLGLKLPENIAFEGSIKGTPSNIQTNSVLTTSEGSLKLDGKFNMGDRIVFDAKVQGDSIALGNLLQNEALGKIQLKVTASGSGNSLEDLDAKLESEIGSFTYNGYEFRKIEINGELEKGKGPISLNYKDENLNLDAQTRVELDSVSPRIDYKVNLEGADLEALGITQRSIKTGFKLDGWYKGNSTAYELEAKIIDGVSVYNNETYLLGSFDAKAYVREDTTSVSVNNRILELDLRSNASPGDFTAAIDRHFRRYISEDFQEDSINNPVNLNLDVQINESPILNEVFLVNLEELDTVNINIDFREKERSLDASVSIPYINYYSSQVDSLRLEMRSDPNDLKFDLAFNELNSGPLAIKKTILTGEVVDRKLALDFSSIYEQEQLVHVNSVLNFQGDTLKFHINPQELILNRKQWDIDSGNQISFATEYLDFENFRLFRNDQEMQLSNDKPGIEKEHLSLDFRNFKLAALLNYLNPENELATGQLNGNVVYEEPFGETGLLADMEINQFKVMGVDLNTLSLEGNSSGFSEYDFNMAIKGGEVDLDLQGTYTAADPSAKIDMNLDLNKVQMSALEGFSQGEIKNGSGSFSGNISLDGTILEPQYDGRLDFNQAKFNIAVLNAAFILPDESLRLDNDGVYFSNFNIQDTNKNSVVLNGEVSTKNLLNPGFDLKVNAEDFRLLNSTKEDNDLFYGTAVIDVDASIKGDLNLPEIDMNLDIKESTNFTYVIPETELQIKERDGVVIFVNKEDPYAILSETEEESYVISGYDIFSRLTVDEGATFNVILNPETGDKFQVQGEGDLIFNMYPNGRTALTGIYDINDGFYEVSLYNLVKRRFDIADGSRVSWAGDPLDAQLDVRAIYRVETSASSLMATSLSATDPQITQRYRQELPFLVYLKVEGDLMEPKITFNLDMPQDAQGAVGGQVFGRVQQLNNQEAELNKQVFSLLVLNRFFPDSGSDGSQGGTLSVARDNLNSALSDQLNMLSSKILGESGVKLNFELDSFTDYQGKNPEDRTQLGISAQKAFMEDRLIVEVGSEVDIQGGNQEGQETSPVIGNVSISYLLDRSGVWRLKGFSKSQYENVIDGQLVVSGIALIFTKEFNKFKNMFEKAVMEKVGKEKENKSEKQESSENEN